MKKVNKRGASLAQYGIIIVLVALGLVPVLTFSGSLIQNILSSYASQYEDISDKVAENTKETTPSTPTNTPTTPSSDGTTPVGPTGGTPDTPIKTCSAGTCSIDFGSFTLNGIPEDFPGFVESSGVSGASTGTTTLVALLDTIADAAHNGDIDVDEALIRNLANKGHELANHEADMESTILALKTSGGVVTTGLKGDIEAMSNSYGIPSEFSTLLAELNDPAKFNPVTQDQKNALKLVNILGNEIVTVSTAFDNCSGSLFSVSTGSVPPAGLLDAALDMNTSTIDDVNSQVICQTGDGTDSGHQCTPST